MPTACQMSNVATWQGDWPIVQVEQRWRVHPNANETPAKALSDAAVTSWAAPSHSSSFEYSVEGSDVSATLTYLRSQATGEFWVAGRSEEHTSELQSLRHLVCRLLLDKKKM